MTVEAAPPPRPRPERAALGSILAQATAVALASAVVLLIVVTTVSNLRARGIPVGFEFLGDRAGFTIADTVVPFTPDHSYLRAIGVGIGNTLFLSALVCLAATVLGGALGVARLSLNPLAAGLAAVWVEGVRNIPPVLLLIFLYAGWSQALPVGAATEVLPGVVASIRGLAVPKLILGWSPAVLTAALAASAGLIIAASAAARKAARQGAAPRPYRAWAAAALVLGWAAALFGSGVELQLPRARGDDLLGGARLTPEFATALFGLTVYTAGFIAEIVRSGIQSVPRGQWEAGRALGLKERQILRLVVAPQMLRVIVPPMTSQYINTVKNSTLAIAIGYSEFMTVMGTVINRTNHALEGTLVIVVVYTAINLLLAGLLNLYNRRLQPGAR